MDLGITPNAQMWNALLMSCCEFGSLKQISNVWDQLLKQNIAIEIRTYTALFCSLWKLGNEERALKLYNDVMEAYLGPREDLLVLCNEVLSRQLRRSDPSHANKLLESMARYGPAPTKETYNILLKHYQSKGDLQSLVSTLEDMSLKNTPPDLASFTIVLDGLLHSGRPEPTRTLFRLMASFKVEPNTAMITAIMHHILLKGDKASLKTALDLLLQMELETNIKRRPNSVTYTQVMDAFYSSTQISAMEAETAVEELWQRMLRFRVKPTHITFEVLVKAAFRNNNAALAMNYFHQQRNRQVPFRNSMFEIMLRNLLMLRELDFARDVINEINISPEKFPTSLKNYVKLVKNLQVPPPSPTERT